MIAIVTILLSGLAGAFFSYFLRLNNESLEKAKRYVFWSFAASVVISLIVAGEKLFIVSWELIGLAAVAGLFVSCVFYALPRAFKEGHSGLSVGIFQSACIMPPLIMSLIFGCDCGFRYTFFHAVGALLVAAGFLKSAFQKREKPLTKRWLIYTALACFSQIIVLSIYQYQGLLTKPALPSHPLLIPIQPHYAATGWFLPVLFIVVALSSMGGLAKADLRRPPLLGLLGSIVNVGSAGFLMLGLAISGPHEATLAVPISSVTTILFYNILVQRMLKEKVDWIGISIALFGIFFSFIQ